VQYALLQMPKHADCTKAGFGFYLQVIDLYRFKLFFSLGTGVATVLLKLQRGMAADEFERHRSPTHEKANKPFCCCRR
jgi:hypothetical protein